MEDRRDWMREATTFENFGNEFEVWNWTKVIEIISGYRWFFEKRLDKSLFEWRWKNSFRKSEIDKICDDWTEFIEAEFQKEIWDGIQVTLVTFRSRNDFVNFSESGLNKIDHLWRQGGEKETDQGNEMVTIWCGCDQCDLWKSQGMCWQGKMHLGTL